LPLEAGTSLSHYTILGPLGAGAMGEVYRAKDSKLGREVAIKVLPEHFAADEERLRRFEREAKSLASLNHPNVAQIHGVDQVGDVCFLVLELVPGESLEERLKRGPLPVDEALEVCRQIAEGLEAAHEAGVIHRDLKPANVRITPEGKVKLLDFGLAKPANESNRGSSTDSVLSTEAGRLLGTPTYMAPEQARGKPIDRRVDIWAFGCVLYECLTAKRAFAGETLTDVFAAVIERAPDWSRLPAATPARVRELLARCLEKDLANRQRGAGDAALELRAGRAEPVHRSSSPSGRSARAAWIVAALGIAVAAASWLIRESNGSWVRIPGRTLRFEEVLPRGVRLCPSDRLMNELAISSDGSRIVYLVEEAGRPAVYSRVLAEPEATRLELGKDVRGPTFSPDGIWLAYFEKFETLMRVPVAGGPPQRIAGELKPYANAAWLPDGKFVYAQSEGRQLFEIDMASGSKRLVAEIKAKYEGFENVAVTPDPAWLLADGWKGMGVSDYRVMAVDRASGEVEVLIENASNPAVIGDDMLVFQRGAALFATRFDYSAKRALGEPRLVAAGVSTDRWGGSSQFAVSPEGTLLLAPGRRRGEGRRVVWASADGTVEPIGTDTDAFSNGLELARAGNCLVVCTLRKLQEFWAIDLIGHAMSPVVSGELSGAALSPDGTEVVYGINTDTGPELRRVPVGGGAATVLLKGSFDPTSVSADGRFVLLAGSLDQARGDGSDILVLDTSLQPPRIEPWIATPARDSEAHFSPDEKWVAYSSNRAGRYEIFVRSWPTGRRDWKVSSGEGSSPRWSPDGRMLYYLDGSTLMAAELVSSEGAGEPSMSVGAAREIFTNLAFAEVQDFAVGRDGRIAMIQLADWELAESRLQVVVGWAAELERTLAAGR